MPRRPLGSSPRATPPLPLAGDKPSRGAELLAWLFVHDLVRLDRWFENALTALAAVDVFV